TTNQDGDTGKGKTPPTLFESLVHGDEADIGSLLPPPPPPSPPNTAPRRPPASPLSSESPAMLLDDDGVPNHSICSSDCAARNTTDNPLTCYGVFQNSADGLMMCECLMMASCNALKVGASFGFKGCSPCQAETKVACGVYDGTTISTLAFFKIRTAATDGGNGATTATDGGAGGGGIAIATGDAGTTDSATSSTVTESEGSNRKNPVSIPTLQASPTATGADSLPFVPLSDASTSSTPTGTSGTLSTTSSSSSIPSSALIAIVVSLVAAVAITIGMAVVYSSRKKSGTLPVLRLGKSSPDDDMTPFRPKSTISPSSSLRSASVGGGASLRSLPVSPPPPMPLSSTSYSSVPLSAGSQQQQQPQSWGWEGGFLGGPDPAAASFPSDSAALEGRRSIDSTVSDATSVRMTTLVGYGHVYTALRPEVVTPPPMPVRPSSAVTGNSANPATLTRRPSDASEDSFAVAGKPAAAVGRKLSAASETSSVAAKFVARAAAMPDFGGHSEPIS
ncbi:hypothetical protein DFJ73DRAFT_838911, partial [Zopfochytrium polystomum]